LLDILNLADLIHHRYLKSSSSFLDELIDLLLFEFCKEGSNPDPDLDIWCNEDALY
jgi:hypothetical protein